MTLRIAIVGHIRHPIAPPFKGGMEAFTHALARMLAERGHDVTLLASGDSAEGLPPGVSLLPICDTHYDARYPWHDYHGTDALNDHLDDCYARTARLLLEGRFDVVHNNALHRFLPRLSRAERLPMVTSLHIPPFKVLHKAVTDGTAPWHLTTVVSERQRGIWWPEGAPQTAHVVHNGIDLVQWPQAEAGDGSAVWAGRITPTKGTHLAAEAAQRAGIPLRIYGIIEHQDYFNDAVKPHLHDAVTYGGHLDTAALVTAYRRASIALFTPQWEEPFGLAAVEAMATGLPVAATPHGAVEEVLGAAGVIAADDTPAALAQAIRQALTIPSDVPRARVAQLFDARKMVGKFEALYAAACAQQRGPIKEMSFPDIALRIEGGRQPALAGQRGAAA